MKKVLHNSAASAKRVSPVAPTTLKKSDVSLLDATITKKKHKIYYIRWRDAFTETDEWHNEDSISTHDYVCETIGFLLETNNKSNYYSIAGTVTIEGMYASIINIPKAMVITKKLIKVS